MFAVANVKFALIAQVKFRYAELNFSLERKVEE